MRLDETACFGPAEILLPQGVDLSKWAVIACDQFTSQPEYWQRAWELVGDAPSALRLILPEAELGPDEAARIEEIHRCMDRYLTESLFRSFTGFVYVERCLLDGQIRPGLVGMVDLEQYDYHDAANAPIRATEHTVEERIPPRKRIRNGASLELPHALMLCDDERRSIIEPLAALKDSLPLLYDFELMQGGGRIRGWLVQGELVRKIEAALADYDRRKGPGLLYAVGDGNHSLATAKSCWEERKRELPPEQWADCPARYALAELENLLDPCQVFAPIHRIVKRCDTEALLRDVREALGGEGGGTVTWCCGTESGELTLDSRLGHLPVGVLQTFLDRWLEEHPGEIDYIHGDEALRRLSREKGCLGFLVPVIDKDSLFAGISADGVLPRKAFSMGHAEEKRYYLEARAIR